MHKKLLGMVLSVALLGGLMVVGAAAPALAAPPTDVHNFLPDDTEKVGNSSIGTVLSDRFDGFDQTVHLTAVATPEATRVQWRLCAAGTVGADGTETLTQAQFSACTIIIGEDATPTTPAGNPPANVDEAYEFNWDIPGTEDGATRDLVAAACIGAGEDVEDDAIPAGDETNCVVDVENQVQLEDAQTGITQTPAGEITSFCTADPGGPTVALTDLCVRGEGGTNAAVDARFQPFVHGDNVPNEGFTFRARVSDDATSLSYMNGPGDAVTDPNLQSSFKICTQIFAGTNFREFECTVEDAEVANNAELHLTLIEELGGGTGFCINPIFCQLDSHYIVSNARRAESVVATFEDPDPAVTDAQDCADPDDAETNNLGSPEAVLFCVTDQFGQPFNTAITFESSGPSSAGFDGTADCTAQNHDAFPLDQDGVDEHCDGSTGADGVAHVTADNPDDWDPGEAAIRGVQTITACVEGEPFTVNPVPTDHGCADEPATLKDTVAKTWESDATVVRLVFGDKTADCVFGDTFKENLVGETDSLKACTYDAFGNPTTTTGTNDGFLEWSINTGADDEVDTQFAGPPPAETDADAEAVAVIEALNQGTDFPTVTLRSDTTGNTISSDSVQKNVRNVPGPGSSAISIRHKRHRFKGRVTSSDAACISGRKVVLKRVKPGRDATIGTDVTSAAGKYSIRHRKTRVAKRYYTKVRGNSTCGGARSRTLRRR